MSRRTLIASSLVVVIALLLTGSPSLANKKAIAQYQANAMAVDGAPGSRSAVLQMSIYKWSDEDDQEEVLDAIKEATENKRAYRAVPEALRKLGKAGYMFLAGGQGWPIRYARQIEADGRRQILLATDRPVTFSEVYRGSAVRDFDITLIVLEWEDSDKGEGIASVGTEIKWNETKGQIEITNFSSQPVRLGDVRTVE